MVIKRTDFKELRTTNKLTVDAELVLYAAAIEYAKSDSERQLIIDLYEKKESAITPPAFTLDATKSVGEIADDLLVHVSNRLK